MPNRKSRRSQLQKFVRPTEDVEMKSAGPFDFAELEGQDIFIREELDHGTYARVYKAHTTKSDEYGTELLAVKRQYIQTDGNKYEIQILHELGPNSQYIPELLDIFYDRKNQMYSLVLPYYEHVPFTECMKSMSLSEFQHYARNLFRSLAELHKAGYVHRDVKPGNFLYVKGQTREENQYVLLDFGLAERIDSLIETGTACGQKKQHLSRSTRRRDYDYRRQLVKNILEEEDQSAGREGTRGFRPPEVLMRAHFQNDTLDIWSAGIILAAIVTTVYPLFGSPEDDTKALFNLATIVGETAVVNAGSDIKRFCEFWRRDDWFPEPIGLDYFLRRLCESAPGKEEFAKCPQLFDLLVEIFSMAPTTRPNASQILRHPFFHIRFPN